MQLILPDSSLRYDVESLCRVFFPQEKIQVYSAPAETPQALSVQVVWKEDPKGLAVSVRANLLERREEERHRVEKDRPVPLEEAVCVCLFQVLCRLTGLRPKWGILTGVRPAKLMHRLLHDEGSPEAAKRRFVEHLRVVPEKADLALRVANAENKIISLSQRKSFSLYVSIPFCPTRCSYCSFVSHSIASAKKLMEPYVERLAEELKAIAQLVQELDLRLETIYFGGGTPTSLDAAPLSRLFETIREHFDLSHLREYTVEAGRPDTITRERLLALKAGGVDRISINPQTFNDQVLEAIGRRHTAQQTLDAFALARDCGFDHINMDFIAGLPGETQESFRHSLRTAVELGAESITVHTLALKRSSNMGTQAFSEQHADALEVDEMVEFSHVFLSSSGYEPYYMYRQSKSVGNLENVGWSKPGRNCFYNVFMMDETHTILAAGAGAVTKLRCPDSNYLERIYNFKYPYEYINRFSEMLERKGRIIPFYHEFVE